VIHAAAGEPELRPASSEARTVSASRVSDTGAKTRMDGGFRRGPPGSMMYGMTTAAEG
jgi:hypothetical protein